MKSIAKNVEARTLRKQTKCIGNKPNMSPIWIHGFELVSNHHCKRSSNFRINIFLKNVKNCVHCRIGENFPFDSVLWLSGL